MARKASAWHAVMAGAIASTCLSGCEAPDAPPPPEARPVRFVRVERRAAAETLTLTGQIQAQQEIGLAFRLSGRVVARRVGVGDRVEAGEVVAQLDPETQRNAVTSASAAVQAANGQLAEASAAFGRQQSLFAKGFATRAQLDQAQQQLNTARSQVSDAEAQLASVQDQLGYTDLRADAAGTVTATGAEAGEVVSAGQTVLKVAAQGGRDAVFAVPASLLRSAPRDVAVTLALTDDPRVTATGKVREVAPQADPTTRMFQVKVGLADPPAAMRLGATVTGSVELSSGPAISVPASALTEAGDKPAVWTVAEPALTVALRPVEILRYEPDSVVISAGLQPGEVVVTAGVQALRPGQRVRLLGDAP